MDLVAAMLMGSLRERHGDAIEATQIRPTMPARFTRVPGLGSHRIARNADRLAGRFVDYPRYLASLGGEQDLYHIVDHSYAHLVNALPRDRTIVTCHDVDTFRSVLEPAREPRSWPFRAMTRHILGGLRNAAFVTCDSLATRGDILAHRLVPPDRCRVIYLGVSPIMTPEPDAAADAALAERLGPPGGRVELLHVGSTIPRKRIDVLLRVFAAVHAVMPEARLIRVGGPFTVAQEALARELGLGADAVTVLPVLSQAHVAAAYRRAAVVLQPSDAEGFGLPVAEAMACGAPVIASDLPVLREVGGTAARYCAVGDIPGWSAAVLQMLRNHAEDSVARLEASRLSRDHARKFSWSNFCDEVVDVYNQVAARRAVVGQPQVP